MKNLLLLSLFTIAILCGCKKEESEPAKESTSTPGNPCSAVSNISAGNITTNSATLYWGGTPRDFYQVEYGINGYTFGEGTLDNSNENRLDLSALSSDTAYDYYIRGNCGGNSWSDWAGPNSFVTD